MEAIKKPSVTELIDILNKPALIGWANRIGLQGTSLDEYRKRVRVDGSKLHKDIENFFMRGEMVPDLGMQKRLNDFISDKEVLECEKNVETEWFVGRFDIKFKWHESVCIADFKTNHTNIYLENRLQLAAYWMAELAEKVFIISVPDVSIIPVSIVDFDPYEEMLKCLSRIYFLKQSV